MTIKMLKYYRKQIFRTDTNLFSIVIFSADLTCHYGEALPHLPPLTLLELTIQSESGHTQ